MYSLWCQRENLIQIQPDVCGISFHGGGMSGIHSMCTFIYEAHTREINVVVKCEVLYSKNNLFV